VLEPPLVVLELLVLGELELAVLEPADGLELVLVVDPELVEPVPAPVVLDV
jgi:hypothetical protein